MAMTNPVKVFTDGSCVGNPGEAGYGYVMFMDDKLCEVSEYIGRATNNQAELMAIIDALDSLQGNRDVTIYTDATYVVKAFKLGWLRRWKTSNWKSHGRRIANQPFWERLLKLTVKHRVEFFWVEAHAKSKWNNRADQLARLGSHENTCRTSSYYKE